MRTVIVEVKSDIQAAAGRRILGTPLTDDGDALRLAVRLGIVVNVWVSAGKTYAGDTEGQGCTEQHNGDSCAATRRAIVRAAAAIAKTTGGTNDH